MKTEQLNELLYQALETELGGVQVYAKALTCAVNPELKEEWQEYLDQTKHHVEVVRGVFEKLGLDPETDTPGRKVVRHIGASLVKAIEMAKSAGKPEAAQLVAAECVVLAETKDHLNWELIGEVAKKVKGEDGKALKEAHDEVEDEEDEHLYHTTGWTRELWIDSLGLPAVLPPPMTGRLDLAKAIENERRPSSTCHINGHTTGQFHLNPDMRPPEEEKDVKTATGAAPQSPVRTAGLDGH